MTAVRVVLDTNIVLDLWLYKDPATPALLTAVAERFGIGPDETTADSELTLEIVYCLGSCALAPVAVLDGRVIGRMRKETLLRTLQSQVNLTAEKG